MENNEDFKETMISKLKKTDILKSENANFRSVYLYNMEKIKNQHLEGKEDHNKVNDLFSFTGDVKKPLDSMFLTKYLKKMIEESKLGKKNTKSILYNKYNFF